MAVRCWASRGGTHLKHACHVVIGVMQRGDARTLCLFDVGAFSVYGARRFPFLGDQVWHDVWGKVRKACQGRCTVHTDGAFMYRTKMSAPPSPHKRWNKLVGDEYDHFWVNHQAKQWLLCELDQAGSSPTQMGTLAIDGVWRNIRDYANCKDVNSKCMDMNYIFAAGWQVHQQGHKLDMRISKAIGLMLQDGSAPKARKLNTGESLTKRVRPGIKSRGNTQPRK